MFGEEVNKAFATLKDIFIFTLCGPLLYILFLKSFSKSSVVFYRLYPLGCCTIQLLYPHKRNVEIRLSVCPSVCLSVQNKSFCQSAGWGIKSHVVTALGLTDLQLYCLTNLKVCSRCIA